MCFSLSLSLLPLSNLLLVPMTVLEHGVAVSKHTVHTTENSKLCIIHTEGQLRGLGVVSSTYTYKMLKSKICGLQLKYENLLILPCNIIINMIILSIYYY